MPKLKIQTDRKSKLWLFALICMVSLSACVKKSTFEALQAQYQNEQKQTEKLQVKLVTTEAQRDQLSKDKNALTKSFDEEKKKNTALLSDRSALQAFVRTSALRGRGTRPRFNPKGAWFLPAEVMESFRK